MSYTNVSSFLYFLSFSPQVNSMDNLCEQPRDLRDICEVQDASSDGGGLGFSKQFFVPLVVEITFLYFLWKESSSMEKESKDGDPSAYPVKDVSIVYPVSALVLYPAMIYLGKEYMKDKQPFQIRHWIFMYNMYQCVLNAWTVYEMIKEFYTNPHYKCIVGFLPWGSKVQPGYKGFRMSWLVWIHYNNKYVELLDTVWMVLRKKNKQITLLHCYHHVLLIWVWWHCCSIESGGEAWFGACINSLIHVYMYGYYTLSLLKWKVEWMKIYMTTCQMLQFVVCLIHASFVYYQTTYGTDLQGYNDPRLCADQAFVMVNMLALFGHFFYKSYMQKSSSDLNKRK